jgi:hypothetical protein
MQASKLLESTDGTAALPMIEPGSRIGRYDIQRLLGRDGFITSLAHDPPLDRQGVIEIVVGTLDTEVRDRFAVEISFVVFSPRSRRN